MNIKTIYDQLPQNTFARVSKSYIINMSQVTSFNNNTSFGPHYSPTALRHCQIFHIVKWVKSEAASRLRFPTKKSLKKPGKKHLTRTLNGWYIFLSPMIHGWKLVTLSRCRAQKLCPDQIPTRYFDF